MLMRILGALALTLAFTASAQTPPPIPARPESLKFPVLNYEPRIPANTGWS